MNRALTNLSLREMDQQSLVHGFTSIAQHEKDGPFTVVKGQGITLTRDDGTEYLDAIAGLWCANLGWGNEEIRNAIKAQLDKLEYYHVHSSMSNEPSIRLAHRLLQVAPAGMSKVLFGNSGSDANDTNVKLVWYYNNLRGKPKKKKIISRKFGYHGVTIAAGSLTGLPIVHKNFDLPIPNILHVDKPHHYWNAAPGQSEAEYSKDLAERLDARIRAEGPDTVAAFIAEPVMAAGGVIPPPEGYFDEIQAVLKHHDILMLVDEVVCGFGRTGAWFGSDQYGIKPDLMAVAKGLTSAYIPMSASIIGDKVWDVLSAGSAEAGPIGHGYTYSGHPVAAAAGLASLDILERENIVGHVEDVGPYFQAQLRDRFADNPLVGEVRGIGLLAAVEFVKNKDRKEAFDEALRLAPRLVSLCRADGLIVRALNNATAIAFSPPLIINRAEIDRIVDIFANAVDRFTKEIKSEGLWGG